MVKARPQGHTHSGNGDDDGEQALLEHGAESGCTVGASRARVLFVAAVVALAAVAVAQHEKGSVWLLNAHEIPSALLVARAALDGADTQTASARAELARLRMRVAERVREEADATARCGALRAELDASERRLSRQRAEAAELAEALPALQRDVDASQAELEELKLKLDGLRARSTEQANFRIAISAEIDALRLAELSALAELEPLREEAASAHASADLARRRLEAARVDNHNATASASELDSELAHLRSQISDELSRARATAAAVSAEQAQLAVLRAEDAKARGALAHVQSEIARRLAEREEQERRLGELEARLRGQRAELEDAKARIARTREELEGEGATLAGLRGPATRSELERQLDACARATVALGACVLLLLAATVVGWVREPCRRPTSPLHGPVESPLSH